jgi:hypothetical protein
MAHGDDQTLPEDVWPDDDPRPDDVETALLLAWDDRLGDCPDATAVAGWTPGQRREAFRWATDEAGLVPAPEFLKRR